MARKLLCLVALISLVSLVQAAPGFAETYDLMGGYSTWMNSTWTETRGMGNDGQVGDGPPGTAFGNFLAQSRNLPDPGIAWDIELLQNPLPGTVSSRDQVNETITYNITYTTPLNAGPVFSAAVLDSSGKPLTSNDFVVTTTATYLMDPVTQLPNNVNNNGYVLYGKNQDIFLTGTGTDLAGDQLTLNGVLYQTYGDHNHYGYATSLTLDVTPGDPSAVPLPGAVWLLGSGLFGLACLRPYRKS